MLKSSSIFTRSQLKTGAIYWWPSYCTSSNRSFTCGPRGLQSLLQCHPSAAGLHSASCLLPLAFSTIENPLAKSSASSGQAIQATLSAPINSMRPSGGVPSCPTLRCWIPGWVLGLSQVTSLNQPERSSSSRLRHGSIRRRLQSVQHRVCHLPQGRRRLGDLFCSLQSRLRDTCRPGWPQFGRGHHGQATCPKRSSGLVSTG